MCWNPDISINTFIFVCVSLLFIYVTNTFTKYKSPMFDNPLVYLLLLTVGSMQLIEFFLWKNLKNKKINEILSIISSFLVVLHMYILMIMIPNSTIRYNILLLYTLFLIIYFIYKQIYNPILYYTSIGKNGHLSWEWFNYKGYENIWIMIFLLFYIIPLFLIKNHILSFFAITTMLISFFFYFKYNTFGTMWCWSFNLLFLYCIINILLIQPYYEYNSLC